MKKFVSTTNKFIKNLFYSNKCPICHEKTKNYICDVCYTHLMKITKLHHHNNFYYIYDYKDIKNVISDFKLNGRKNISKELASLIKRDLLHLIEKKQINIIIPVPISKKRYLERGFNQVEELLKSCHIKYTRITRTRDTEHMYKLLTKSARNENIKNAFNIGDIDLNSKNILIVDDIVTTGATINGIIREIEKVSIVNNIYVFSVAMAQTFLKGE